MIKGWRLVLFKFALHDYVAVWRFKDFALQLPTWIHFWETKAVSPLTYLIFV